MDDAVSSGWLAGECDEFGVPLRLFGPHPEPVWGAIGRTVSVSALLEDRLITLLQRLGPEPPAVYAKPRPTGLVKALRDVMPGDDEAWDGFATWLDDVAAAFEWRNDVVHNLWPAQPGERFFGHRIDPKTGERRVTETTTDELPRRLRELVGLLEQWDKWFALANQPLRTRT